MYKYIPLYNKIMIAIMNVKESEIIEIMKNIEWVICQDQEKKDLTLEREKRSVKI